MIDCPFCNKGTMEETKSRFMRKDYRLTCSNCGVILKKDLKAKRKENKYVIEKCNDPQNGVYTHYKDRSFTLSEWDGISKGILPVEIIKENIEVAKENYYNEFIARLEDGTIELNPYEGTSSLILKKGEILKSSVSPITFLESRAVRVTKGSYGGPSFRIAKGVYYRMGSGKAISESHQEIREIDKGEFSITNKRIIFRGNNKNINIDLDKIVAIEPFSNGIGISVENKDKVQYFKGFGGTMSFNTDDLGRLEFNIDGNVIRSYIISFMRQL